MEPTIFYYLRLHPNRFNFQQKDKLKSAYKLLELDLTKIVSEKIWKNIFDKDDGYVKLRNRIVHQGYNASIQLESPIDMKLISKATLDIAEFIYSVDIEITNKYPKIEYSELYFKQAE